VKEQLKELLARRQKQYIHDRDRVPAAVLIPLYRQQGQCHIVFIKRTETVKEHKGQISFPGGSRDNHDRTLLDTASVKARKK
jgi:8-oxo-dGTP pyrophosphatase MutT (NUDIX family)